MNVLVANKFFYKKGGSEQVFFQERAYLKSQGVNVVDFSMDDDQNLPSSYSDYFVKHIDFNHSNGVFSKIYSGYKFVHSSEAGKKIGLLIEKEKPDIAHLHNIYHQLTPSIITTLKERGVRVVLTLHDYKLICPTYNMRHGNKVCGACGGKHFWKVLGCHCQGARMKEALFMIESYWHYWKRSYENVDLFLAPSQFLADLVSKRVDQAKVIVLKNGIDPNCFRPKLADKGYGLYLGRISDEKGIKTLLAAHSQIADKVKLKIAGTGPEEQQLKENYPMAQFLGYQTGQALTDIITNAAYAVVPSECNENCSMAVLEAMAAGKPVIGSRIGGIPEQILDRKTGLLFKPGDADELSRLMGLLSENHTIRSEMGIAARKRIEQEYTMDSHGKQLMDIYTRLIAKA